jgi:predicted nucleic acid-binding protein
MKSHGRTSDHVTDHYLADLAAKHGLKLATFDGQLEHPSVELVR